MIPLILNDHSGSVDDDLVAHLHADDRIEVVRGDGAEALRAAVRNCADQGPPRIIAAGGDGTVHLVANGLLEADAAAVELGILPCGTGNDLARTLALPDDLDAALDLAAGGTAAPMDVLRLTNGEETRYAVNASAGGFAGAVNTAMDDAQKAQWGPLAYLLGAAEALPELDSFRAMIEMDGRPVEESDVVNVILANGRYIAGGKEVAPPARLRDGRMDIVLVHQAALPDLAAAGARLLAGNWLEHPLVTHQTAARVRVDSTPPMRFNADGELWAEGQVDAEVVADALQVVRGGV